jgi:hypothetical protein
MKRIIRLTESDLERIVRRIIKENEQDWIDQSQDMDVESDFSKMELENIEEFQELVSFFEENPDIAQEIKKAMNGNVSEAYKYYDYSDSRGKKEITRNEYLKRKLINYGIWGILGAIVGATMGTMSGEGILQAALLMAGLGGTVGAELSGNVGREKVKESRLYEQDEEWGETDEGEETLQDLIEDARDFLENECGYDFEELNQMSEQDIVDALYDEGNDGLAEEIEDLLREEGFDTEKEFNENWDDFDMKRKYDKYKRIDYRKVPKNPIEPGAYLDYEGTKLKKSDDDDDFNEWGMDGDDEEYV